jgi:hypothetical protein
MVVRVDSPVYNAYNQLVGVDGYLARVRHAKWEWGWCGIEIKNARRSNSSSGKITPVSQRTSNAKSISNLCKVLLP